MVSTPDKKRTMAASVRSLKTPPPCTAQLLGPCGLNIYPPSDLSMAERSEAPD